jgi:hypothetical protein
MGAHGHGRAERLVNVETSVKGWLTPLLFVEVGQVSHVDWQGNDVAW